MEELQARFSGDHDTRIVEELGLCQGEARVDIAVINGALHGYEIKSERDTLERLPGQQTIYSSIFDTITIVVGPSHIQRVSAQVPGWWGIRVATTKSGNIALEEVRCAGQNPNPDPSAVVQLLWRDEAFSVLEERGLARGLRSKPRRALWEKLTAELPPSELGSIVRQRLKRRPGWRAG